MTDGRNGQVAGVFSISTSVRVASGGLSRAVRRRAGERSATNQLGIDRPCGERSKLWSRPHGGGASLPTFDGIERRRRNDPHWDRARVAQHVAIEVSFGRVNTRMRRKHLVEVPGVSVLRDNRADAYFLRDEGCERSRCIR